MTDSVTANGAAVVSGDAPRRVSAALPSWVLAAASVALIAGVAALSQRLGLTLSASATDWIAGMHPGVSAPHAAVGRVLRTVAQRLGATDPLDVFAAAQLINATVQIALVHLVARLAGLGRAAWLAPIMLVGWAGARSALGSFSVESLYATASLALCASSLLMATAARAAAMLAGSALYALAIGHPVGLLGAALWIVALAIWPRPGVRHEGLQVVPVRAIWLPWIAGVALFLGLLAVSLPRDRLVALWDVSMADLRRPLAAPMRGGLGDMPLVGAAIAMLGRVPLPVLLLATAAAGRALFRERAARLASVAAAVAVWLIVEMVAGSPHAKPFDSLVCAAPLLTLLAVAEARRWLMTVWGTGVARPAAAVAMLVALMFASAADDLAGSPGDPRSAFARFARLVDDPTAGAPATLTAGDVALLAAHPARTAILPAHRGGNDLGRRLRDVGVFAAKVDFADAYAADHVLLHLPARDPVQAAWQRLGRRRDCTADGRRCLFAVGEPTTEK